MKFTSIAAVLLLGVAGVVANAQNTTSGEGRSLQFSIKPVVPVGGFSMKPVVPVGGFSTKPEFGGLMAATVLTSRMCRERGYVVPHPSIPYSMSFAEEDLTTCVVSPYPPGYLTNGRNGMKHSNWGRFCIQMPRPSAAMREMVFCMEEAYDMDHKKNRFQHMCADGQETMVAWMKWVSEVPAVRHTMGGLVNRFNKWLKNN